MVKIVILGAGSMFGGRLCIDCLARKPLQDCTIALCDLHPDRLQPVHDYVEEVIRNHNLPARVISSINRLELLEDADFVVTSISVGGRAYSGHPYTAEMEIPRKYGIDQIVGDTIGPGGVFRFLRTMPVQAQMFADMERLCPEALVLNHTNPMAMLSWAHSITSTMRYAGMCHGVQHTADVMARLIGERRENVTHVTAGINHLAWFLQFRSGKEDLYPRLWKAIEDPKVYLDEGVRIELMKHFGYFPTESNRHDSEYLPYFRKSPELMEHFKLTPWPANGRKKVRLWDRKTGEEAGEFDGTLKVSQEYASGIIESSVTNVPFRFTVNVMNDGGLIANLPNNCCVEVPCFSDARGIHPTAVGKLPTQLAALVRTNISVQELAVEAFVNRDREAAFHACAVDPLTAAVLPLHRIREMFDEMWAAEGELLAYYDRSFKGRVAEPFAE